MAVDQLRLNVHWSPSEVTTKELIDKFNGIIMVERRPIKQRTGLQTACRNGNIIQIAL